jgi:vancomycin permeability regulator SanA
MLADRVQTGVDLYRSGKVNALFMMGGNNIGVDEAFAMRSYALKKNVFTATNIVVDNKIFRTIDRCYRASHIYHIRKAIIITQSFHMARSLFLCKFFGINAIGVYADYHRKKGYRRLSLVRNYLREYVALIIAVLEIFILLLPRKDT